MDEGILVAYPQLVSDGLVPGKDFETFYGPGQPYIGSAVFELFGASVDAERGLGFALRLMIVLSLFALARPWGAATAFGAGIVGLLVLVPLGVSALSILGAIGFGLAGLALLSTAGARPDRAPPLAALAGLAGAVAIAFRPDIGPAIALGGAPLLVMVPGRIRIIYLSAVAVGLVPTLIWLGVIGPEGLSRLVEDLISSREGRRLPLPGPLTADGAPLVAGGLFTLALIVQGWRMWRARDEPARAAIMLALGLFALGIMPTALQRADNAHVLPFACVALAGLAPLTAEAIRAARAGAGVIPALFLGLALFGGLATARASGPALRDDVLAGGDAGYDVRYGDRTFPVASEEAATSLNAILEELDARADSGETLFTGPRDLSRTAYTDTFLYFLTPALEPASFYLEVNRGTADASDSGLAEELRSADWLVLTSRYENFDEASDSVPPGSDEPNQVVDEQFSVVARDGSYVLMEHD